MRYLSIWKSFPSSDDEIDFIVDSINTDIKHTNIILDDFDGATFYFRIPEEPTDREKAILFNICTSLMGVMHMDDIYDESPKESVGKYEYGMTMEGGISPNGYADSLPQAIEELELMFKNLTETEKNQVIEGYVLKNIGGEDFESFLIISTLHLRGR